MNKDVRINGVDSIKFDDNGEDGGQTNIGLGKDIRPFKVKYKVFFQTILPLALSLICLLIGIVVPYFTLIMFILSAFFAASWSYKRGKFLEQKKGLFDKPKYLKYTKAAAAIDYAPKELIGDVKKAAPGVGKGVFFFGHEMNTGQELHAEDGKVRTHIIIFGTTGSGKTENILSLCVNFLVQSSGFILTDGKGDTLLFAKCFALCRAFGRTDDVYFLNFMPPTAEYRDGKRVERITNTFNFLPEVTPDEANAIIGGLLPNDSSGLWEGRASTGISTLNQAVYYLKDNGFIDLDPDIYRTYFTLDEYAALAMNDSIPKEKRGGLWTVLKSVSYKPPSEEDPNPKQNPTTEEQFQYITMQYTETFNMLADEYSHITVSQVPDISITDIVLRRRILLVLLPSLAKAEQQVRNLGRIIIAMTRNVSSKAIGSKVEGDYKATIESKPTAAISSFGLIFDEFGAYATAGASTLPAQVRSLNMVCVFAGQDYEAFRKGSDIEAATIFANCTIKICMKLEDPSTFEKFDASAGKQYVMVQEGYEAKDTMFGRKFKPSESARVEQKPVLDIKDLKEQSNGLETLIYGSKTYRLAAFYADPIMPQQARLNHLLEIRRPSHSDIATMRNGVDLIYRRLKKRIDEDWEAEEATVRDVIVSFSVFPDEFTKTFNQVDEYGKEHASAPIPTETELVVFAFAAYAKRIELVDHNISKAIRTTLGLEIDDFDDDELLGESDMEGFSFKPDKIDKPKPTTGQQQPKPITKVAELPMSPDTVDTSSFDRIEKIVGAKKARLKQAELESFDSLEAINLSAFDIERGVQGLEELLLRKSGVAAPEAHTRSKLVAANTVVELGLSTNVAIASGEEKKKKSPSRSSKEFRDMISQLANNTKGTVVHG